jgi:hypothetical protein
MRPLISLPLEAMIELVSATFAPIPDPRRPDRVDSSLHDTLTGALRPASFLWRAVRSSPAEVTG